jgi:predicted Zn-dependent peptidase
MKPYQVIQFSNGFKVVLFPKKELYSVVLNLYIRAGHIFEDPKTLGLSHFAEHMIFKGTSTHPTPQLLNKYQDEIAFHPTAYTSSDHVSVYGVAPRANLDLALQHLTRLVQNSQFREEDIEKERSVITEEFLRRRDNPDVYLWDVGMQRRFKGKTSFVCRSVIDSVKNVNQAPTQLIKDFYHQMFTPSRILLGIAGDISQSDIRKIIDKSLTKPSKPSKYFPKLDIKDTTQKSVLKIEGDFSKVYLLMSWPIFRDLSPIKDGLIYGVLSSILNRRIWEVLREDLGVVYDFSFGSYSVASQIYLSLISTSFERSKFDVVVKVIDEEINKIKNEEVLETEVKQHVRRMNQTSPMSFDYPTSALSWVTSDIYFHDKVYLPDECIEIRNTITPKDVQKLAKEIFNSDYLHISAIGPVTQKDLENTCKSLLG